MFEIPPSSNPTPTSAKERPTSQPVRLGLNTDVESPADAEGDSFFSSVVSMMGSFSIHLLIFLILTLWFYWWPVKPQGDYTALFFDSTPELPQDEFDEFQEENPVEIETAVEEKPQEPVESQEEPVEDETPTVETPTPIPDEKETTDSEPKVDEGEEPPAEVDTEVALSGGESAAQTATAAFPSSAGYDGRDEGELRGRLIQEGGGNAQSEDAVTRALGWLYAHQQIDPENKKTLGSWTFNLGKAQNCRCTHRGEHTSSTGATAMALLAMLGHGNTREKGEYKKSVAQGLYYLSTRAVKRKGIPGYDLREGTIYSHVMATLALCEALSMETKRDRSLEMLAKGAVEWLLWAQDPNSGGWRYQPREAGDITVTTWVIMVLKSAQMAGFEIPTGTMAGIHKFLDSVASENNTRYSYQAGRKPIESTTAMGLFARMFTGAKHDEKFLADGAQLVADWGHSGSDLYYDYYATMFLRHYGGPCWESWNPMMRDYLIATQSLQGHEYGSWYFDEPDKSNNQTGGRLYTTALATMILEVYYRYMPIYQEMPEKR